MIRNDVFDSALKAADTPRFIGCTFCDHDDISVLTSTENFNLVLDRSPLVEGHLMIVSKAHYGCAGELPAELLGEFVATVDFAKSLVSRTYGPHVFLYEHGRAGHCDISGDIMCHHFHLHFVPADVSLVRTLGKRFHGMSFERYDEIPQLYQTHGDYLLVENPTGEKLMCPASGPIEPHLLRTLAAGKIGRPFKSDWQECIDRNAVKAAFARYAEHI